MRSREIQVSSWLGVRNGRLMTRRQVVRRAAVIGLAVPSMSALLAACEINIGVDDDDEPDEPVVEPDDDDDEVEANDDDAEEVDVEPDDEVEPEDDDDVAAEPDEDDEMPELNLETLEAETASGIIQAQRAENSFVGEIADGRVVGIAFRSEIGATEDPYDQDEIVVFLYDRQNLALLVGDMDADGEASLRSVEESDFEASVELTMEDDVVTGSATFGDEEPASFTADAANGDAGVYSWVRDNADDADVTAAYWVVLADGRQWGCACLPPFADACCGLGRVS